MHRQRGQPGEVGVGEAGGFCAVIGLNTADALGDPLWG